MQYVCKIGTPDGRVVEQSRQAADAKTVRSELEQAGFHVFEVRPASRWSSWAPVFRRSRRIPPRELMVFNQELAALLRAGLPLLQSIEMMLERARDPKFAAVLRQVRDRVKSGEDLSDAIAEHKDVFPPLYGATLKAGERSGELEPVIRRYLRYQKLVMEARSRVISALVYPVVLVVLSVVMMAVMAVFVVPKFTVFYSDLNADLPMITEVVIGLSTALRANWLLVVVALAGSYFTLRQWMTTETGAVTVDRLRLKAPILGGIFHRLALAEYCRSLSTLLTGGIPLASALDIAAGSVGNAFVRSRLSPTVKDVREGKAFHVALEETGVVPDVTIDMVRVGEATGALDSMLGNTADFYDEEVETRMERILSLVEPFMLVFMGLVVATLLVAIYLPLFSVLGQAQF